MIKIDFDKNTILRIENRHFFIVALRVLKGTRETKHHQSPFLTSALVLYTQNYNSKFHLDKLSISFNFQNKITRQYMCDI